jgi:hypothetical protein
MGWEEKNEGGGGPKEWATRIESKLSVVKSGVVLVLFSGSMANYMFVYLNVHIHQKKICIDRKNKIK